MLESLANMFNLVSAEYKLMMNKAKHKSLLPKNDTQNADISPPPNFNNKFKISKWLGGSEKQNEVEFDNEYSSTSTTTRTKKSLPESNLSEIKSKVLSTDDIEFNKLLTSLRKEVANFRYKALALNDITLCYAFPKNLVLKGNLTEGGMSTIDVGFYTPHNRTGGIEVIVKRVKVSTAIPSPPQRNAMMNFFVTVFDKRSRRQRDLEAEVNIAHQDYTWQEKQIFERTKLELKALAIAQHFFVVDFYEAFMYRREIYMITERCVGDFRDIIGMKRNLQDFYWYSNNAVKISEVYHIMAPIADALAHLHSKNFLHKDIKEQNILLTRTGVPKLCDFGICKEFEQNEHGLIDFEDGDDSGSEFNIAPELVKRISYDLKVDSWGFGVTMLTMSRGGCLRVRPGDGMWEQVTDALKKGLYETKEEEQDLYSAMLLYDKHNVFNTGEPQKYQEFYQIVKSLVSLNPADRILVSDLTEKQTFKEVLNNWMNFMKTGKLPSGHSFKDHSITEFKACSSFYREKIEKFIANTHLSD